MKFNRRLILLIIITSFVFGNFVLADNLSDAFKPKYLGNAAKTAGYNTTATNPDTVITTVIRIALSFVGVIFLVLMIYGGYLWMMARGNEDQVTKAKNLITAAIIGLIIVIAAYAISMLVVGMLSEQTLKQEWVDNGV